MTEWQGQPAIGVVLAKLVELHTRLLRVDAERKQQRKKRLLVLTEKASR